MTVQDQQAPAVPALRGTTWALLRYTAGGVTASLSADMRTTLSVDGNGTVRIASGLIEGVGRLDERPGAVSFADLVVFGPLDAMPVGVLEERIVRGCDGPYTAEVHGQVLRLRRDGVTLDFVPQR